MKCGDYQSTPEGLVDAALVLHHSIYLTSSRVGASKYDYKMYAIVHQEAKGCSQVLQDAGFEVVIKNRPVETDEIRGLSLRRNIHKEWCCGHEEFIKLYAYNTLPEPIVVHVDIDFIFKEPMDNIFDALLYDKESSIGKLARRNIERERARDPWPDQPQAFMTRDWPQVYPGRIPGYQAGFIALRPNPQVFDDIVEIIKEGNYSEGNHRENGWGNKGYGGYVGARAMQGLVAYYYDIHAPDTWVELNQCRYNHMGVDVKFSPGGFGFLKGHLRANKCRNGREDCEDCRHTDLKAIYNIHYTQCRKPWNCIGEGSAAPSASGGKSNQRIPENLVVLDHCLELLRVWHTVRTNLETQLTRYVKNKNKSNTQGIDKARHGPYKPPVFQGHCSANGKYLNLASGDQEILKSIAQMYQPTTESTTTRRNL